MEKKNEQTFDQFLGIAESRGFEIEKTEGQLIIGKERSFVTVKYGLYAVLLDTVPKPWIHHSRFTHSEAMHLMDRGIYPIVNASRLLLTEMNEFYSSPERMQNQERNSRDFIGTVQELTSLFLDKASSIHVWKRAKTLYVLGNNDEDVILAVSKDTDEISFNTANFLFLEEFTQTDRQTAEKFIREVAERKSASIRVEAWANAMNTLRRNPGLSLEL